MQYHRTKRKYIDSIFIFLVGTICIVILSFWVKLPVTQKQRIPKPTVSIDNRNKFVYLANTTTGVTIHIFDTNLQTDATIATQPAQQITWANVLHNHFLYEHGLQDSGIDIDSGKTFINQGAYVSPTGNTYLSITHNTSPLTFSITTQQEKNTIIQTQTPSSQLDTLLGWSPDGAYFYYTTSYVITKQASMSATDHWMQKVGNELKPMSKVRTWIKTTTTNAKKIFYVDIAQKKISPVFDTASIGPLRNVFYNNQQNTFFLANETGFFTAPPNGTVFTPVPLLPKTVTAVAFSSQENSHSLLYADGAGLGYLNPEKGIHEGIFYATNAATIIPLALEGTTAIFSLQDNTHIAGELLDTARKTRTEFISYDEPLTATSAAKPLIFASWLKQVHLSF